ncbi:MULTISPECIES: hypothetical protein [Methylobacterium]|nr:hypothetical protein [Methylobacterium aquaticum]QRE77173.1 hypothetical protein F1D61_29795 [Methylobacterium aquaticum]
MGLDKGFGIPISYGHAGEMEAALMTNQAHNVVQAFDAPMQSIALGLAGVLVQHRAAYAEARVIRQQAAVLRARRVAAAFAAERAEQHARAEDDRLRDAIMRRAIIARAKRARG